MCAKRKIKVKVKSEEKAEIKNKAGEEVVLKTPNDNGLFNVTINDKGKEVRTLSWEGVSIIKQRDFKVLSANPAPKYQDYGYTRYLEDLQKDRSVLFLEPMGGFENHEYFDVEQPEMDIAELKRDGHRGLLHMGTTSNRAFSRNIIKRTDWWGENSDCVPHIRDSVLPNLAGTVLDGEFDYGTDSSHVQSVMGSLPARAVQYQFENGFISFYAFDILYYKGINIQAMPLWKRKVYLLMAIKEYIGVYGRGVIYFQEMYMPENTWQKFHDLIAEYFEWDNVMCMRMWEHVTLFEDFELLFKALVNEGREGIMTKDLLSKYEQKKTKKLVKHKKQETWDVIMTSTTLPTKEYEGTLWEKGRIEEWRFWEYPDPEGNKVLIFDKDEKIPYDVIEIGTPVSKPYAMGWCGGINFAVTKKMTDEEFNELVSCGYEDQAFDDNSAVMINNEPYWLIQVGTCKGLSEEIMEDIKQNGDKYCTELRVLEVTANQLIDKEKGSLRHPRFFRWRDDKNFEQCTFNAHIREEE